MFFFFPQSQCQSLGCSTVCFSKSYNTSIASRKSKELSVPISCPYWFPEWGTLCRALSEGHLIKSLRMTANIKFDSDVVRVRSGWSKGINNERVKVRRMESDNFPADIKQFSLLIGQHCILGFFFFFLQGFTRQNFVWFECSFCVCPVEVKWKLYTVNVRRCI